MPNRLFFILLILFAPFGLGACTPVGVAVGAGAKVISASQSERGLEGTAKRHRTQDGDQSLSVPKQC